MFSAYLPHGIGHIKHSTCAAILERYQLIREDKLKLEREAEKLDKELKTVIVPVIDKLGRACIGSCVKDGVEYMITYKPTYRTGISGDNLTRLEAQYKNIFDEFATKTESRRVFIKQRSVV